MTDKSLTTILWCNFVVLVMVFTLQLWDRIESLRDDWTYEQDSATFKANNETWEAEMQKEITLRQDMAEVLKALKAQLAEAK